MDDLAQTMLLVLGAGGHGKVVAETARGAGWSQIRFLDDDATKVGKRVAEWMVEGPLDLALRYGRAGASARMGARGPAEETRDAPGTGTAAHAVIAIGDNALRLEWLERLERADVATPLIVAPSAVISRGARLGLGTVVIAGAVVAIGADIGRGAIINTACSIDHDCVIGDGVHVSPGARLGGNVRVGARSWIGIGASIVHGVRIGADAVIGAGAAVVHDVPDGAKVGGVPARPLVPNQR